MIPNVGDIIYLNDEFVRIYLSTRGDYWVAPFIGEELEIVRVTHNTDANGNKINPTFAHCSVRFKIVGTSINNPMTQCNIGIDLEGKQHGIAAPVFKAA